MSEKANQVLGAISQEWQSLVEQTPVETRERVRSVLRHNADDLRQRYHDYLNSDPDLMRLMGTDGNSIEFTHGFMAWVAKLVDVESRSEADFFSEQHTIGESLARIGFPPHAVSRAIRKTKLWFLRQLAKTDISRDQLIDDMTFVIRLFDLSLEIREDGYEKNSASNARVNEAYRLHLLGQNLAMERERQRAALMEWGHGMLATFYQRETDGKLPRLQKSDFGLWLNHEAHILFEREPKLERIKEALNRIDTELVPALERLSFADPSGITATARRIEDELAAIKFALNAVFDAHIHIENGRDPLTHLLTRRFAPSVLMREIQLQKAATAQGFCVLILDVDHFKNVNDTYGHKGGDSALKNIADKITESVRRTDFVFRYGGEEILIVLVECDDAAGLELAENVRKRIADMVISLPEGGEFSVTVSIGLAAFQGEMDYEQLLLRADKAVYEAKENGRNRVVASCDTIAYRADRFLRRTATTI